MDPCENAVDCDDGKKREESTKEDRVKAMRMASFT